MGRNSQSHAIPTREHTDPARGLTEPGPNRPNTQQARSTPASSLREPAVWCTPAWLSIAGRTTTEWNCGESSALTGICTKTVIGGTRLLRDSNARPPQTPSLGGGSPRQPTRGISGAWQPRGWPGLPSGLSPHPEQSGPRPMWCQWPAVCRPQEGRPFAMTSILRWSVTGTNVFNSPERLLPDRCEPHKFPTASIC